MNCYVSPDHTLVCCAWATEMRSSPCGRSALRLIGATHLRRSCFSAIVPKRDPARLWLLYAARCVCWVYKRDVARACYPQAQGLPSPPTLPPILPQSPWSSLPSSPSPSSHLRSSRSRPARSASLRAGLSARASRSTASRT
jgi:hypothetical protein